MDGVQLQDCLFAVGACRTGTGMYRRAMRPLLACRRACTGREYLSRSRIRDFAERSVCTVTSFQITPANYGVGKQSRRAVYVPCVGVTQACTAVRFSILNTAQYCPAPPLRIELRVTAFLSADQLSECSPRRATQQNCCLSVRPCPVVAGRWTPHGWGGCLRLRALPGSC
jgi:hypothetical protein